MRATVLDDRLARAAALFPACAYGADIGADHGRLSCYLLQNNICERMCVADISAESLKKSRALLEECGLSERADIIVGDGFAVLPQPAQAIAVLGMGGRTLCQILAQGINKLNGASLILSAHTDIPLVRSTLMEMDYRIEREEIAFAGGRYYVLLRAVPGAEALNERQLLLGPRLIEQLPEHYQEYLEWRAALAEKKRSEEGKRELSLLREELNRVCNRANG